MAHLYLMILFGLILTSSASNSSEELPCHVLDSVDITDGLRQEDGSILFNNNVYPRDQYATVDYILEKGEKKFDDYSHIRGCACKNKYCIRLCCPYGTYREKNENSINGTSECVLHREARIIYTEVLNKYNNELEIQPLDVLFAYVDGYPCQSMVSVEHFYIKHNGQILYKNNLLTQHNYCLEVGYPLNGITQFTLFVCHEERKPEENTPLINGMIILSALFIIITLLIYACLPKLHSLQGKCMICYLIALAFGYTLIAYIVVSGHDNIKQNTCRLLGFLILITLISSFLWLNVLNFNIWLRIYPTELFKHWTKTEKLQLYALYGFGVPYIWTLFVYIFNSIESLPPFLQPGVGENNCFLNNMFLYFYLPSGISFAINIALFISIFMANRQVTLEQHLQTNENKKKEIIDDKLFVWLTIVMGIIWSLEVIADQITQSSSAFACLILFNAIQGIIIFILFVLNRHVLRLIKERCQEFCAKRNPTITSHTE